MRNQSFFSVSVIAFLLQHLVTIEHIAIHLIYDNRTQLEADDILDALHSVADPVTCYNFDRMKKRPDIIRRALTISLVDEKQTRTNVFAITDWIHEELILLLTRNLFIFIVSTGSAAQ